MLKVLSKALMLCAILGPSVQSQKQSATFVLESRGEKITYSKNKIKKICSINDINLSASLIDSKMAELLKVDAISSTATKTIHDFAGNDYVVATYGDLGYGILNVANDDVVEIAPFSPLPFDWDNEDVRYVPWVGFYEKRGSTFFDTKTGEEVSVDTLNYLGTESQRFVEQSIDDKNEVAVSQTRSIKKSKSINMASDITNYPLNSRLIYADVEVPYSWYFKRNINQYPKNDGGYCGYVAASLLLAYNEIFNSTGYFSKEQSAKYITPYTGIKLESGWDGVPTLANSFPKDVWGENIGKSVPSTINDAIHQFMSGKGKEYEIYNYVWQFATVTDPIKQGVPAAYFGNIPNVETGSGTEPHVVTAYGYFNDGKLLVNYGWEGYSQVVMSQLGLFDLGGVIAIYNKSSHKHNKYFSDRITRKNYCGCGALMEC